jgi:hypothetical protein
VADARISGGRTMAQRRPDHLENLQKAMTVIAQLAPLITAVATAAVAGHSIGWW